MWRDKGWRERERRGGGVRIIDKREKAQNANARKNHTSLLPSAYPSTYVSLSPSFYSSIQPPPPPPNRTFPTNQYLPHPHPLLHTPHLFPLNPEPGDFPAPDYTYKLRATANPLSFVSRKERTKIPEPIFGGALA